MPHATGTRAAGAIFLGISLIPPWIQAIVTLPIAIVLLLVASKKERERKRELNR